MRAPALPPKLQRTYIAPFSENTAEIINQILYTFYADQHTDYTKELQPVNCVIGDGFQYTKNDQDTLTIHPGTAIKDNVMIETLENVVLHFGDPNSYHFGTSGYPSSSGVYNVYVALKYRFGDENAYIGLISRWALENVAQDVDDFLLLYYVELEIDGSYNRIIRKIETKDYDGKYPVMPHPQSLLDGGYLTSPITPM